MGEKPCIMGILNVTPDSFHDGGRHNSPGDALSAALSMEQEGADVIDLGGESTRPGSETVSEDEELRRVMPVLEALQGKVRAPISIDTSREVVARQALRAGARIINDVTGLRRSPGMARLAAETGAGVVIMHMQGTPRDMQDSPRYEDVVSEILRFLRERISFAREEGVAEDAIVIDPGLGFGKRVRHNIEIISRLGELKSLGYPVLLGPSRKSFLGRVADVPVEERMPATAAVVALGVAGGADILRVHDVREMRQAADVAWAIRAEEGPGLGIGE